MEFVRVSADGGVGLVEIDRPPVNALSEELALELAQAFRSFQDPAIRAVVVTGRPHFAAGGDIHGFKASLDAGRRDQSAAALRSAIRDLELLEKPTIAAVHGFALGGGLELALGADFRYLAEDAEVGQPEIQLGLIPGAGGTQRLTRVIGLQKAKEMIFTGRHVKAEEALDCGLADDVAPTDEVLDMALRDARDWAGRATLAIGAAKRAINEGSTLPLDDGIALEAEQFDRVFASEDGTEGVGAFVEKRRPGFHGR